METYIRNNKVDQKNVLMRKILLLTEADPGVAMKQLHSLLNTKVLLWNT